MRRTPLVYRAGQAACLLVAGAAGLLSLRCSSGALEAPPAPPVDWRAFALTAEHDAGPSQLTSSERAVAEAYLAALSLPGFPKLGARLDPGAHFAFPGMSDARGVDAVVHAHELLFGPFDPRSLVASRIWRTDNAQAIEWTLQGTQSRDWMGIPPSGRQVSMRGLTLLWTKDDGRITDVHVYFDVAAVRVALGLGPDGHPAPHPASAPSVSGGPLAPMPAGHTEVYDAAGSTDEAQSVAVARSWLDALEANDLTGYVSRLTDDVEISTPLRPQLLRGKDDARGLYKWLHKSIGQLDTTVENVWAAAPYVIVEYSMSGGQLAPIGWVPMQRDKVVRLDVVDVMAIVGSRIAAVWRYENTAEIAPATP